MVDDERYFSEVVRREQMGKRDEEDLASRGVNASSGPREGVVAVNVPDGAAVRNVPLDISMVDQELGG
jgi:hypothetical protein